MHNKVTFEKVEKCDLCGSKKSNLFLKVVDRNYKTGKFSYVKCSNCNLIWLSPRPKNMSNFYPERYIAYKPFTPANSPRRYIRNLINKNDVIAKILIKDQLFFWKSKGKLLDVGSGNGSYMQILKDWGWDTYGVEVNDKAVEIAKKSGIKNIKKGDLFSVKYPSNHFDLVRFSHVMEHVPSPQKELKETKRILKKDGHVLILIPNINSIFSKLFKSYWYPLDPPRHLYQFSPQTLSLALKFQGFSNIKIKYNQSPYTLIRSISFLMGSENVEKRMGILVYPLGIILRLLNLMRASDTIEVTAKKL